MCKPVASKRDSLPRELARVLGVALGQLRRLNRGIRVGLSTVQGLALAAGRPCLGVSTLDILAALARGEAGTVVPMIDAARSGHVFSALYDGERKSWIPAAAE